ncbi:MAG: alpha/beta hydrolase-fold protein [Atopobiaceae bacterium]|nr:alpha/beta hydrolase-fold protein [Atopobiaceae bacterium]MDY4650753.1 alpha/beta hydrolase-fold protein [Atopobiaceae bacterium]MDY5274844.1 alpha/beta hydrolase-fold protein [Atopobiaceae bacterium]
MPKTAIVQSEMKIVHGGEDISVPIIYAIDAPEFPFSIEPACEGIKATVVKVPVMSWDENLTPWTAESPFRGRPDYAGKADATAAELLECCHAFEAARGLEPVQHALIGYSLGGLFALHAFLHNPFWDACASLSGSLWYPGWAEAMEHLALARDVDFARRSAYLSVGAREAKAPQPQLRHVVEGMAMTALALEVHGCNVRCEIGPGAHTQHEEDRWRKGMAALDSFLA